MKINEKILKYFEDQGISKTEIAESYGGSAQNVWNILNRESGKVPLEFLVWVAENHPDLDLNSVLRKSDQNYTVHEDHAVYVKPQDIKQKIMEEINGILNKYL